MGSEMCIRDRFRFGVEDSGCDIFFRLVGGWIMKKVVYKANREPSGAAGRGCKRYFIKLRTAYGRYFVSIKLKAKAQ